MNQYSELLYYLKELGESELFVNTVTKGNPQEMDLETSNVFPIFHIDIVSGSFTNTQTVNFNVSLACLSERDINKEIDGDKFWSNDNEVDNHNETLAVLNRVWGKLYKDFNNNNITASENPVLEKVTFAKGNILDGWEMTFDVEMPNTTIKLCGTLENPLLNSTLNTTL